MRLFEESLGEREEGGWARAFVVCIQWYICVYPRDRQKHHNYPLSSSLFSALHRLRMRKRRGEQRAVNCHAELYRHEAASKATLSVQVSICLSVHPNWQSSQWLPVSVVTKLEQFTFTCLIIYLKFSGFSQSKKLIWSNDNRIIWLNG